jgi:serine/threonine protein kinase
MNNKPKKLNLVGFSQRASSTNSLTDATTGGGLKHSESMTEMVDKVSEGSGKVKLKDSDLEYICELGAGCGGDVVKVLHRPTGMMMARKIIGVFVSDEEERLMGEQKILKEMKLLKLCKSKYIVEFYGSFVHENDISICSKSLIFDL